MGIAEQLDEVRDGVRRAAIKAGRSPDDVTLIAVSKTFPASAILEAHAHGQVHFGESRGQELRDKTTELGDLVIHWHFIGRVQSNKAKYIAPYAYRVHALESLRHAEALAERAPRRLKCLVAVNIGREPQKSGVMPDATLDFCKDLVRADVVDLCGLMCIPPVGLAPDPFYEELAHLAARGRAAELPLHELSMGMSSDYAIAIAHGATWVRVGTAIFGGRG